MTRHHLRRINAAIRANFTLITAAIAVSLFAPNALTASAGGMEKSIIVMADVWCPYSCESSDKDPGFFVELVQTALKHSEFKKINYSTAVWERVLTETRKGTIDIALAVPPGDAGKEIDINYLHLESPTCGFTKLDSKKRLNSATDLAAFTSIGIIKGYSYGPKFSEYLDRADLPTGTIQALGIEESVGNNLKKVHVGRIEVALEDPGVVAYWSKKLDLPPLRNAGCSPDVIPVYLGLSRTSKNYTELSKAIRGGIKAAQKSGEVTRLLKKYGFKQ